MQQVLTIAGSDSGGGAGIQADLKTFAALGVHGTCVITALTAQNSRGVKGVLEIPAGFIAAQMDAVLSDFTIKAVKIGMLANSDIIKAVAEKIIEYDVKVVIVDPVMVAKSGDSLLQKEAVKALKEILLPLSLVVTPNLDEAKILSGLKIKDNKDIERAAELIKETGVKYVIVKGGHLDHKKKAVDTFYDGEKHYFFDAPRFDTKNTHGTGCTFSAALVSYLAWDCSILEAVEKSKKFITSAIKYSYNAGSGYGPVQQLAGLYRDKENDQVVMNLKKGFDPDF